MELTKEFVKCCNKPSILRDFLLQAMDQIDAMEEERRWRKFSDEITGKLPNSVKKALANLRLENGVPPFYADSILHEEICEALEAYQQGDRNHALEELAQCVAVFIRMMEFVSKEIEDENADKV